MTYKEWIKLQEHTIPDFKVHGYGFMLYLSDRIVAEPFKTRPSNAPWWNYKN